MAGFNIFFYFSICLIFFEINQEYNQKLVEPRSVAIHTPVIESSIPTHLVNVTPAAAPATQSGQWAETDAGAATKFTVNKENKATKKILSFI